MWKHIKREAKAAFHDLFDESHDAPPPKYEGAGHNTVSTGMQIPRVYVPKNPKKTKDMVLRYKDQSRLNEIWIAEVLDKHNHVWPLTSRKIVRLFCDDLVCVLGRGVF